GRRRPALAPDPDGDDDRLVRPARSCPARQAHRQGLRDDGPGVGRTGRQGARLMPKGWRWVKHINSHERFVHDSIDSLGYDWSRVADPHAQPRYPLRVYLPQTTEDVVRIVQEARSLGLDLTIRAHGHSSNDLVVRDGGSILLTE